MERLVTSRPPRELDWSGADPRRATVDTVLYGEIRSAHADKDDAQRRAATSTAVDDEQEILP
ncbi:hypothetical protein [Streptomyces sp. NPDC096311]|uniref:hypothetical protein n=1 Tax=Streptomyces sp. NPDC096311 TaxID=3366083 RepID=UPI0037F26C48